MTVPVSSPRVRDALEPWCAVGATGALRLVEPPGGAVYLIDGRLTYAESPLVTGVDRRLTASGRLPSAVWRAALAAGRSGHRIADALIEHGHLTPGELELVMLYSLLDAALFLFEAAAASAFESGAEHVLGGVTAVELGDVCREVDRRRWLLADAWPDPAIDTAAVVPVRRFAGHHVALTALGWEIVANADRRRSPVDLARSLGRDTFATLLEVRRLVRAGLVEPGRPGGSAVAESVAAARARAAEAGVGSSSLDARMAASAEPEAAPPESDTAAERWEHSGEPRETAPGTGDLPPLPRRAGNSLAAVLGRPSQEATPIFDDACSETTLLRIRDALEALA